MRSSGNAPHSSHQLLRSFRSWIKSQFNFLSLTQKAIDLLAPTGVIESRSSLSLENIQETFAENFLRERRRELIHWLLFRPCNLDIISNYSMLSSFCTFNSVSDIFIINKCRKELINARFVMFNCYFFCFLFHIGHTWEWKPDSVQNLATFLFMLHLSRSLPLYHWSNMIKRSMTKQGWSFPAQTFSFTRSLRIVRIMVQQWKIDESSFNHSGLVSVVL